MIPKIEIKVDGVHAQFLIDGTDISNCITRYKIEQKAGCPATLEINGWGIDLDFGAKVMPMLPEPWQLYYEPKYKDDYEDDTEESSNTESSPQDPSQE